MVVAVVIVAVVVDVLARAIHLVALHAILPVQELVLDLLQVKLKNI